MAGLSRRIRGLLGTALTWAGAWGIIGAALGASDLASLELLSHFGVAVSLQAVLEPAILCAVIGALSGSLFAGVLIVAEGRRHHRLEELHLGRVAVWGALGAAVLPLGIALLIPAAKLVALSGVFALLGGGSAVATLAIARRGSREPVPPRRLGPSAH